MIFSYLLGDNFLYRLAVYVFVGLAAGFVTIVTVDNVLLPWLRSTILSPTAPVPYRAFGVLPLLFGAILLLKSSPRYGRVGNIAIAFIIGIGTAVALVGAIAGTLLPLVGQTSNGVLTDPVNGIIIALGVVTTLVYFQYFARRVPGGGVRRTLPIRFLSAFGQGFIAITLGALYGGAILT